MRSSLAVFAAALLCAGACDRASLDGGTSGAGGASDMSNTGGTGHAGAGATDPFGASGGQAGGQACATSAACACDSQAPECQPALMTACLGQLCPPSLDDARLVANWSLGSASGPAIGRAHGSYNECPDGSRWFAYQQASTSYGFGFDASGRLLLWYTSDGSMCGHLVCGGPVPGAASCSICAMFADPQPEGTVLIPNGTSNGPLPNCEIDANGRWVLPHLAPPS